MVKPRSSGRRRGRVRAPVEPICTGLTLVQLAEQTDALIGARSGLVDHLSDYRQGRDIAALINAPERKAARQAAMTAAAARGAVTDGRYRLVCVPDRRQGRLTGEAVRRCNPQLWADSRPVAWSLSVTAGPHWQRPRLAQLRSTTVDQLIASVRADRQRGSDGSAQADAARLALIGVYQAIDSARPWGGAALVTTDGWVIGYRAIPTFSVAACRDIALARGVDIAPMLSTVTIGGGWRVVPVNADGVADAAE